MNYDEDRAATEEKRVRGAGWNLIDWRYFNHPHEWVSGVALAALFIFSILMLTIFGVSVWTLLGKLDDKSQGAENARNLLLTFGALIAAPFVIWRTWIAHQQWQVGLAQTKTQTETMQTGLLSKAIEQLGAMREEKIAFRTDDGKWETRTETVPNVEVRLGAIYLLKRLAEDNDRDHGPIVETLCAYVRENSRNEWRKWSRQQIEKNNRVPGLSENPEYLEPLTPDQKDALKDGRAIEFKNEYLPQIREDIRAALNAIGDPKLGELRERATNSRKTDLSLEGAFLVGADLSGLWLKKVKFHNTICHRTNFSRSLCEGANFSEAHCEFANFWQANLDQSSCYWAHFEEADFSNAHCRNTNFSDAFLNGSKFRESHCEGSNFSNAKLNNTRFYRAQLQGSLFLGNASYKTSFSYATLAFATIELLDSKEIRFQNANLEDAILDEADLRDATGLSSEQIAVAYGDIETELPCNLLRPNVPERWIEHSAANDEARKTKFRELRKLKLAEFGLEAIDWY